MWRLPAARWRCIVAPSVTCVSLLFATVLGAQGVAPRPERFTDWTHPVFPAGEYVSRRAAVAARLAENEVLLVPSGEGTSSGETFRQSDDFEYFVGLEIPRSVLAIDGRTRRSLLFAPRLDPRFSNPGRPNDFPGRRLGDDPVLISLSGVDSLADEQRLPAFVADLARRGTRVVVNFGGSTHTALPEVPMFGALGEGATLALALRQQQATLPIGNAYPLVARQRMVKSPAEIALLRRAAQLTSESITRGAARVAPGITERALTGAFIADCMAQGAQRVAFTPIIKSGQNSLWPWRILGAHYDRRDRALRDGELVIYDVGCELDHYVSDVGRTFPVSGRFSPRQRELVDMVRGISDAVIAAARPGVTLAELQRVAQAAIPQAARPYMQAPLYFGHHIGLDTGDPALTDVPLAAGMVFTIEPWYYNHVEAVAVFLEDEILITATGSENLTAALPRDASGLERLRLGNAPR